MAIAIALVIIVVASVLFHFLSPWWATPLASNWKQMDDTLTITLVITGLFFVVINLLVGYIVWRFRHRAGHRAARDAAGLARHERAQGRPLRRLRDRVARRGQRQAQGLHGRIGRRDSGNRSAPLTISIPPAVRSPARRRKTRQKSRGGVAASRPPAYITPGHSRRPKGRLARGPGAG